MLHINVREKKKNADKIQKVAEILFTKKTKNKTQKKKRNDNNIHCNILQWVLSVFSSLSVQKIF